MEIESVGPSAWVMAGLVVGMAIAGLLVAVLSWRFLKSAAMLVIALGMLGGLGVVMYAVVLEEPVGYRGLAREAGIRHRAPQGGGSGNPGVGWRGWRVSQDWGES